jgi:hypothetical protein
VLLVADVSGTKEIFVGWGTSRKHLQARLRLMRYRLKGASLEGKVVLEPQTSRAQLTDIALERPGRGGSLLLAHFTSKYMVRHLRLRAEGESWREEELGTWRMAMSMAPASVPRAGALLVGRLYGDAVGRDGDAFVWLDGKKLPVPTTRGVSAVAAADIDGDGKQELLLCDGWSQRYAAEGRALLTEARFEGGAFKTRQLLELPGEYSISEVQAVDVDGDGKVELLVRGSGTLQLFRRRGGAWSGVVLARNGGDAVAVDLDGDGRHEVAVVGRDAAVITLPKN